MLYPAPEHISQWFLYKLLNFNNSMISHIIKWSQKEKREVPFNEAIRSEIHVLDTTRKATARSCAPCLSSTVGICKASNSKIKKITIILSWMHKNVLAAARRRLKKKQLHIKYQDVKQFERTDT